MRYEFRPLTWTDKETYPRRSSGLFRASWADTLKFLAAELDQLDAVEPVVIQVDAREQDIRLDGMLRANAKVGHPGVAISFQSKYGALRYATDAYEQQWSGAFPSWQANVRAIALALEALRAVDRYGVSRRGEQYTGWRAIGAGSGALFGTADEAHQWMYGHAAALGLTEANEAISPRDVYRRLAKSLHPDVGGSAADWDRLDVARQLLDIR